MALLVLEYSFAFFRISPPLFPPARLRIKSPSSPLLVAAGVCAAKKQRPSPIGINPKVLESAAALPDA